MSDSGAVCEEEVAPQGRGLERDVWGPSGWKFLHACTFAWPERPTPQQCKQMYNFLHATSHVLPCGKCRVHFQQQLHRPDHDADAGITSPDCATLRGGRSTLSKWLCEVHNSVNRSLHKRCINYDVLARYYGESAFTCSATDAVCRSEDQAFAAAQECSRHKGAVQKAYAACLAAVALCILLTFVVLRRRAARAA